MARTSVATHLPPANIVITRPSLVRISVAALAAVAMAACRDGAPSHTPPPRFSVVDIHTHLGGVETWPGKRPNFRRDRGDHGLDEHRAGRRLQGSRQFARERHLR